MKATDSGRNPALSLGFMGFIDLGLRGKLALSLWSRVSPIVTLFGFTGVPHNHRHLATFKAAGIASKFASRLVRSLLSEGRLRYETVEKTKDGLTAFALLG